MAKKLNFANEIDSIANSVEGDVDRVISLLRDGQAVQPTEGDGPQDLSRRNRALAIKTADHGRPARKRQLPHPVHPLPTDNVPETERILENVTTRLTRQTNLRLTEASLRQKLAKRSPDSRQDIIEEALLDWLTLNGYVTL